MIPQNAHWAAHRSVQRQRFARTKTFLQRQRKVHHPCMRLEMIQIDVGVGHLPHQIMGGSDESPEMEMAVEPDLV